MYTSMSRRMVYDNWEKLVEATLKRELLRELALCPSFSSSSSIASSSFDSSSSRFDDSPFHVKELDAPSTSSTSSQGVVVSSSSSNRATNARRFTARFFAVFAHYIRKKPPHKHVVDDDLSDYVLGDLKRFSIEEVQVALDSFSNGNLLGINRLGKVNKGRLADGSLVAVKILGERTGLELEFQKRYEIGKMGVHPNVLRLLGICKTPTETIFVYPYLSNGSVASCLRDGSEAQPILHWWKRKQIAVGSARGLAYLHDQCDRKIIHCDVKAANILLGEDFEAVIGDFGTAVFMEHHNTHVVVYHDAYDTSGSYGTLGHIAPEYLYTGECSQKLDVYSYGVMLLELITGQSALYLYHLAFMLDWVKRRLKRKRLETIVDANLRGNYIIGEVEQLTQVALLCTQDSPSARPEMFEVIRMLEGDGLAERWEEFKEEILRDSNSSWSTNYTSDTEQEEFTIPRRFSIEEVQVALDSFSNENLLGINRLGTVKKGRLADGSLVAVKRLRERYGGGRELEFQTRIEIGQMTVHPNVLRLLGICVTPTEIILVYPYLSNGSVASCLRSGRSESQPVLDWSKRKPLAVGSARGLAYLHDQWYLKIIHCDVKAANILLDENFEAIIGGFGMAVFMDHHDTHVTIDAYDSDSDSDSDGALGHIAPEHLSTNKCSEKTDVYSYGVILLELITGKSAFDLSSLANDDDAMLLNWVKRLLKEKRLETIVDANLRGNYIIEEVEQLIQVALLCMNDSPSERPEMSEVVRMLEGDGLVERWDEFQKEEMLRDQIASNSTSPDTEREALLAQMIFELGT